MKILKINEYQNTPQNNQKKQVVDGRVRMIAIKNDIKTKLQELLKIVEKI